MQIGNIVIPEVAVRCGPKLIDRLGHGREIRRDRNTGMLVAIERDENAVTAAYFMTECCMAASTYPGDGGGLCCKVCWEYVNPDLDQLIDVTKVTHVK